MGYCVGMALLLVTNLFATKPTWNIKPDIVVCSDSRVTNLRIDRTHLGTTKTWWRTDTGEIFKAKIEIKVGWENRPRILEHELGHALGFKDNNSTGHMMNHAWDRGGYKKKGLQRQ